MDRWSAGPLPNLWRRRPGCQRSQEPGHLMNAYLQYLSSLIANRLAGLDATPADSDVLADHHPVTSIYAGIDITGEDLIRRPSSADTYLAHHPVGRCLGPGFLSTLQTYGPCLRSHGLAATIAPTRSSTCGGRFPGWILIGHQR